MLFRILGPLEMEIDGRTYPAGKNRQLIILALFLLEANRGISVAKLIEAVWGSHPPRTAEGQIQTCVWRLRRSLADAGLPSRIIDTIQSGYIMRIDPSQVDSCVFDKLVKKARAAMANGNAEQAAAAFRQALGLFYGQVLAEVPSTVVQTVAAQWEERRLSVLEECIDIELSIGRGQELVSELTTLVEEHPLRERLRGQLMLVLHRSDRRAEALATYRSGRRALVSQLGIEPGSMLQELHHKILADEITVPARPFTATASPGVPAQLPTTTGDFVARPQHTGPLFDVLTNDDAGTGPRICAVLGKCGVGKSALAVHVAHRVRDHFPDGQLYADLGGTTGEPADPVQVLGTFLWALGMSRSDVPENVAERVATYRSVLANRRVLVVLDDVAAARQVRPLLPGGSTSAVVLTSRTKLTELPGGAVVDVDVLSEHDAVEMLGRILEGNRTFAEPQALTRIVRSVGYLPLLIRATAARLIARPHLSLARFADRLQDADQRLDEVTHGDLDIRKRLAASARILPADAKILWYELGLVDVPDFGAWVASAARDVSLSAAEHILDHLVDNQLVDIVGEDDMGQLRYRFHEIIRLYAKERARQELPEAARSRVLTRIADRWITLAERARTALGQRSQPRLQSATHWAPDDAIEAMVMANPGKWLRQEQAGLEFALRHVRHPARQDIRACSIAR